MPSVEAERDGESYSDWRTETQNVLIDIVKQNHNKDHVTWNKTSFLIFI